MNFGDRSKITKWYIFKFLLTSMTEFWCERDWKYSVMMDFGGSNLQLFCQLKHDHQKLEKAKENAEENLFCSNKAWLARQYTVSLSNPKAMISLTPSYVKRKALAPLANKFLIEGWKLLTCAALY